MQLEKQKQQEMAKRRGLAVRTVVQSVWLLLSGIVVYLLVNELFAEQILTYGFFYSTLSVPAVIPEWAILALLILVGVVILQFFFILGYVIVSPEGRAPTGRPTSKAQDPDPLGDNYRR